MKILNGIILLIAVCVGPVPGALIAGAWTSLLFWDSQYLALISEFFVQWRLGLVSIVLPTVMVSLFATIYARRRNISIIWVSALWGAAIGFLIGMYYANLEPQLLALGFLTGFFICMINGLVYTGLEKIRARFPW